MSNVGLVGCGMEFKIEAGCEIKIFKTGREMKIQRQDRDKLHFEGAIRDRTATCGIVSGQRTQKYTLLLLKWAMLFCHREYVVFSTKRR